MNEFEKELWRQVFVASIRAGAGAVTAKDAAKYAADEFNEQFPTQKLKPLLGPNVIDPPDSR